MSAKTGQVVTPLFTTADPASGAALNADALPTGTLYLNGTANGATVTVTNVATGLYKASVTMPALAAGDRVSLSVSATVNGVTGKGIIWGDMGETATASDVQARLGAPAGASVVADIATRLATAGYTAPPSIATLATAANLATVDTVVDGIAAKTTNLPASPAAVGSAMVLTALYDAAKTAAAPGANMVATNMVDLSAVLAAIAALPDDADVSAVLAAIDAVLAKTNTIGTGQAIVQSPITPSGTITVYSGDDYASADSRAITVTVADTGHMLGLDEAVVKLKATQATWEAASVASTTDGYTVTFEATAAQTAAVTRAQHYELEATLANGHVVTLARGSLVTRTNIPAVV